MNKQDLWRRYRKYLTKATGLGIAVDSSRMPFKDKFWSGLEPKLQKAYEAMHHLEAGSIANPDEQRMVGHYWLRNAGLAPTDDLADQITQTVERIKAFAEQVHDKQITPQRTAKFSDVLVIGIGGSALGPQLIADCLGTRRDKMRINFIDNTDPDGIERLLQSIQTRLKSTITLVVSKSGGTAETRNGMVLTKKAYEEQSLDFAQHAVAVTGEGSKLDKIAKKDKWLERFPMWDWVGGRTSVTSAVGLLPMALQGLDVDGFLQGASDMDRVTRLKITRRNPAARLAAMWHFATGGAGERDMVVLPYKDRLLLMSRYLQQLVMESLGKEHDLDGNVVNQGLAVYGNKGSTDQHAYVQQLRDGLDNFFVTFIVVHQDVARPGGHEWTTVDDEGATAGDYLHGFWQGTREALWQKRRGSISIICRKLDAKTLGALIALFERAVGLYAELIHVNAYHQPGVEAGKKAAASVLELQHQVVASLQEDPETFFSAEELAQRIEQPDKTESIYHLLQHLALNKRGVQKHRRTFAVLPPKVKRTRDW